jgi:hypothetical protein
MEPAIGARILLIGILATALVDLWAIVRERLFGTPLPNYGLVGRWFAYLARGRFRHDSIAAAPAVSHERLAGWTAHYLIGIAFAVVLVAIQGVEWLREPSLGPALAVGIVTVVFPLFLMQPGMGAGIAASRTPRPTLARIHSLATHAVFGLGLFVAAEVMNALSAQ